MTQTEPKTEIAFDKKGFSKTTDGFQIDRALTQDQKANTKKSSMAKV